MVSASSEEGDREQGKFPLAVTAVGNGDGVHSEHLLVRWFEMRFVFPICLYV